MSPDVPAIALGVVIGLIITVAGTMAWPRQKVRWLRPILPPVFGVAAAYVLMRLV